MNFFTQNIQPDPLGEICRRIAREMAEHLDTEIIRAISNHVGHAQWTIPEVKPRLVLRRCGASEIETITMDGKPIFEFLPLDLETVIGADSTYLRAGRKYRVLNDPTNPLITDH